MGVANDAANRHDDHWAYLPHVIPSNKPPHGALWSLAAREIHPYLASIGLNPEFRRSPAPGGRAARRFARPPAGPVLGPRLQQCSSMAACLDRDQGSLDALARHDSLRTGEPGRLLTAATRTSLSESDQARRLHVVTLAGRSAPEGPAGVIAGVTVAYPGTAPSSSRKR